jgi:hypothetical protein
MNIGGEPSGSAESAAVIFDKTDKPVYHGIEFHSAGQSHFSTTTSSCASDNIKHSERSV